MVRILIIEDEQPTAHALRTGLTADGFECSVALTGEDGFFLLNSESFDLVVLDWMLPGRDGLEILANIRRRSAPMPVLMLTARDTVADRVRGLEAGADDYLLKPFAFAELVARIRSLLRRAAVGTEALRRQIGDLRIDFETRRVNRTSQEIMLTPREFDLLAYLARNAGQVVSRDMLAREVWRETNRATSLDNVIDVHVNHLRAKLDEGRGTKLLHTIRGLGFVLSEKSPR